MARTLVIAEPGCTAEGDFDTMVRQIHKAADCGADVFKSQWTSEAAQMVARRHAEPEYLKYYGWLQYPIEWHAQFRLIAQSRGLQYGCSVYLPEDVKTIAPYVDLLKISSFEAHDDAMLEAAEQITTRVMISTGMSDREWHWRWHGADILHCVSCYPAPLDAMNIRAIDFDDRRMRCTGLSDHSHHLLSGAIAVACGATVVETHFCLVTCRPSNPDYEVALFPESFRRYIQNIRDAETMLGDGIKRIQPCEEPMLKYRVGV